MKTLIRTHLASLLTAGVLTAGMAFANGVVADTGNRGNDHYGEVLQVTPIYLTVAVKLPAQRCWKRHRAVDVQSGNNDDREAKPWERRCTTVEQPASEQALVAYHVKYQYRGRVLHTRAVNRPGKRIRVDHKFEAVHF